MQEKFTDEGANALVKIFVKVENRLTEEITRLEKMIESTWACRIKWMSIFRIGQITSIVGILTVILFAFFKR